MNTSETYRKLCLKQQTELRALISDPAQFELGMALFFQQHALLHTQALTETAPWSFEDEVFNGLSEA
jgi:hypothetical protein